MTEEEKIARRRERDRARYHRNKERLANDEERKAKMKARRLAWEAADPEHNAKHWAKRKAREAANPEKYAEARRRRAANARAYYHRNREAILERLRTDEEVKAKYRERLQRWRQENPDKVKAQTARRALVEAQNREEHLARRRLRDRARRVPKPKRPPVDRRESGRRTYQKYREKKLAYARRRRQENPGYHTAYTRGRYRTDPQYKLRHLLRTRITSAIKHGLKSGSAVKDLGCTIPELMVHIENLFQEGMSWDNYGVWHLDHVKPLVLFDLEDRAQFLEAAHYTNLQPLWAADNISKHAKYGSAE